MSPTLEQPLDGLKQHARNPKAVACFGGSRDQYQLAWALAEAGLLERLVTDVYLDPRRSLVGGWLTRKYPRYGARHCTGLDPSQVTSPWSALFDSVLMRSRLASRERQLRLDRTLGRNARHLALRRDAALFSYSYYAASAFAPGPGRPRYRFLFQLHPHPTAVRRILERELKRAPRYAESLRWEHEIGAPEHEFVALSSEASLANGWVAASSFTASTMAETGVPRDRIEVIPYGVDSARFPCRDRLPAASDPFRVIWVGSMTQRKGLSYFIEAVGSLPQQQLEVIICGHHAVDRRVIEDAGIASIRILQGLSHSELVRRLHGADLFVLPSLAEGFGHAILEAMSAGVAVVTTPRTCATDIMVDGREGFIVQPGDAAGLAAAIQWAREHRSHTHQMGRAAAARAREFTWERFRRGVVSAYRRMLASVDEQKPARMGILA